MQNNKWLMIDKIAADLGVSPNTRRVWRQRKIPFKYWLPILEAAKKKRLPIIKDDLCKRYAVAR